MFETTLDVGVNAFISVCRMISAIRTTIAHWSLTSE